MAELWEYYQKDLKKENTELKAQVDLLKESNRVLRRSITRLQVALDEAKHPGLF